MGVFACTCGCWPATTTTTAPKPPSKPWPAPWTTPPAPTPASPARCPPPKGSSKAAKAARRRCHVIDLHVHTSYSDGRLAPREVVAAALERDLSAIAITDHDVVSGLAEASAAAAGSHLEVVPGIEMTCAWEGHERRAVHILGYFIDPASRPLQAGLRHAQGLMERHVGAVLEEIRKVGGDLGRADLDRYRHRYAGGAALVLGMLERGVLKRTPPGTGMHLRSEEH